MFSLESPHRGDSNVNTQYTIFIIKKENHSRLCSICSYGIFSLGTREQVRNSGGKRAISVRATEVLLYIKMPMNPYGQRTDFKNFGVSIQIRVLLERKGFRIGNKISFIRTYKIL